MTEKNGRTPIDIGTYIENRAKFPVEELARYMGEHVAFSADGTRIVAHGPDMRAVLAQLQQLGLDASEVGWSIIPNEDSVL
jgi:hypothetical protein